MTFNKANAFPYSKEAFLRDVFVSEDDYDAMRALLLRKKNLILQGAPGTGKTFAAKRLAYSIMEATDDSCIKYVQFHQNSSYEDYVVGFRPNHDGGFDSVPGILTNFFSLACEESHSCEDFFLIIDEINRANISKVFGELLMLIEADHRGDELTVPGLLRPLRVPKNVFIIGMMNTADRSLAVVDYALRRRFAFFSMHPALDDPKFIAEISSYNNEKLISLVSAVREVNVDIENDPMLGSGFCIGHSYFCFSNEKPTDSDVRSIVEYELIPLLREYWFDPADSETLKDHIKLLRASVQ